MSGYAMAVEDLPAALREYCIRRAVAPVHICYGKFCRTEETIGTRESVDTVRRCAIILGEAYVSVEGDGSDYANSTQLRAVPILTFIDCGVDIGQPPGEKAGKDEHTTTRIQRIALGSRGGADYHPPQEFPLEHFGLKNESSQRNKFRYFGDGGFSVAMDFTVVVVAVDGGSDARDLLFRLLRTRLQDYGLRCIEEVVECDLMARIGSELMLRQEEPVTTAQMRMHEIQREYAEEKKMTVVQQCFDVATQLEERCVCQQAVLELWEKWSRWVTRINNCADAITLTKADVLHCSTCAIVALHDLDHM